MKRLSVLILSIILLFSLTACKATSVSNSKETESETAPSAVEVAVNQESETDVLEWVTCGDYSWDEDEPVRNIILMIGDGMGENIMKNAEIVKGDALATSYMPYSCYVGTDSLSGTTDSAAASTAISCGVKTVNQYIGTDENGNPVETIIEFAKARGLKTGLVATHIISHATPAGMVAHVNYRGLYNDITKQMINAQVDVLLGGGAEYTETNKMKARISEAGYQYIRTSEELSSIDTEQKVMGIFSYYDMTSEDNPSLTTMTEKALEVLEGEDGFFLMVEASHIDIFEAEQNMEKTMMEMQAFDKAIDYTLRWAEEHPGTLVLVTADHETGGVTVPESLSVKDVNNNCFTSNGEHTSADVLLFAAGAQADTLFTDERTDNTEIANLMRKVLNDTYGEAPVTLLN